MTKMKKWKSPTNNAVKLHKGVLAHKKKLGHMNLDHKKKCNLDFEIKDDYLTVHQVLLKNDYYMTPHSKNAFYYFPHKKKYRFHAFVKGNNVSIHIDLFNDINRVGDHTTPLLPKLIEKEIKRIKRSLDFEY